MKVMFICFYYIYSSCLLPKMWNSSSARNASQVLPGSFFYSFFVSTVYLLPMFILNVLLILATVTETSIKPAIRMIVGCILAASEVVIVGLGINYIYIVILLLKRHLPPSEIISRLTYAVVLCGGAARLLLMATFAVAISVLVIHGESKLKLLPTCIAVGIIWIFAVAPNASVFSPVLFDVMYPNSSEFTARGRGAGAIVYAFSYVTIYGICSFVISCIALIVTVCYIKRKTISGDVNIIKGMVKFGFFLFIGDIANFFGVAVPFVSIALKPQGSTFTKSQKIQNFVEGLLVLLSLIPTPIILLIFFKAVRDRIRNILCCKCRGSGYKKL